MQECMHHSIAFHAELMGNIMYLHQALEQDDSAEFIKDVVVVKEVNDHIEQKHWRLMEQSKVPEGVMPLPSIWAMRWKPNQTTWLNIHGRKQEFRVNYYETFVLL